MTDHEAIQAYLAILGQASSDYPPLNVDVAHGLALLFGMRTRALVWDLFSQEV